MGLAGYLGRQHLQGGHRHQGAGQGPGQGLGGGQADAQAGEVPRPDADPQGSQVGRVAAGRGEQLRQPGQQAGQVGAALQGVFHQEPLALDQGQAARLGGRVQGQDEHGRP